MGADDYDVPFSIKSKIFRDDCESKKIELVNGRDQMLKLQCPIYEDQEDQEFVLKLLREFQRAIERHNLWNLTDEAKVYDMFQ